MYPSVLAILPRADWHDPNQAPILLGVVFLAGVGTTVLFLVSLIAYRRRRSAHYLLISLALSLLVVRTIVGFATVAGAVPMIVHHLVSHSLDFLIAALVLYTVYLTGQARNSEYATLDSDD